MNDSEKIKILESVFSVQIKWYKDKIEEYKDDPEFDLNSFFYDSCWEEINDRSQCQHLLEILSEHFD